MFLRPAGRAVTRWLLRRLFSECLTVGGRGHKHGGSASEVSGVFRKLEERTGFSPISLQALLEDDLFDSFVVSVISVCREVDPLSLDTPVRTEATRFFSSLATVQVPRRALIGSLPCRDAEGGGVCLRHEEDFGVRCERKGGLGVRAPRLTSVRVCLNCCQVSNKVLL